MENRETNVISFEYERSRRNFVDKVNRHIYIYNYGTLTAKHHAGVLATLSETAVAMCWCEIAADIEVALDIGRNGGKMPKIEL